MTTCSFVPCLDLGVLPSKQGSMTHTHIHSVAWLHSDNYGCTSRVNHSPCLRMVATVQRINGAAAYSSHMLGHMPQRNAHQPDFP
jgi:hypothetical protein